LRGVLMSAVKVYQLRLSLLNPPRLSLKFLRGRSSIGRASLTVRLRPSNSLPFHISIAF